jgi:hypothetical protein
MGSVSPATGGDEGGGGVLGNLPRSRPGQRSDKRGGPDTVSAPAGRGGEAAADHPPSSGGDDRPRAAARPVSPAPGAGSEGGGALDGAARAAGRAARLGLGVAGGVLRRLPRP